MGIKESITLNYVRQFNVSLEIMLTTFCNINCDYCCKKINHIPPQDRRHIDVDVFSKAVDQIFSFNKNIKYTITLIGGEITLHPHLDQIIKILAKYKDQIFALSMLFNGKLDFKKYIDLFPAEKLDITVSIHKRMISNDIFNTTIQNIINGYKKIKYFNVLIMIDPLISEDPEFWENMLQKLKQQLPDIKLTLFPLNDYKYNDQMINYIHKHEAQHHNNRVFQITDEDNNVIHVSKSDIKSSGRISFKDLYCYSFNLAWHINFDGRISKFCGVRRSDHSYSIYEYDKFFTSLTSATPCPLNRCGCGLHILTKKTINKQEVEEFYKKTLTK